MLSYAGYPPGHSRFYDLNFRGHPFNELYENTMARLEIIQSKGYKVKYIWEHEYKKNRRAVSSIVHDL